MRSAEILFYLLRLFLSTFCELIMVPPKQLHSENISAVLKNGRAFDTSPSQLLEIINQRLNEQTDLSNIH